MGVQERREMRNEKVEKTNRGGGDVEEEMNENGRLSHFKKRQIQRKTASSLITENIFLSNLFSFEMFQFLRK